MRTTYAVVGATGRQGGATARALLRAGADVRALVRDPAGDAARELRVAGADPVRADLTDPASLRAAFIGVDGVYAMTTSFTPRGTAGETADGVRVADAVRDAGVDLLVYSSVGGAERHTGIPHFESKRRVEEHVTALGLRSVFVRPVYFMENLPDGVDRDGQVLRLPLPSGVPLQMVAVDDIGAVAAAALLDPARVPDGAVEIAGDELTGEQIAAVLGVRYESVAVDVLDDPDLRSMFRWFAGPRPTYDADFSLTTTLAPATMDLRAWAAARPVGADAP